jgi:hypothetical protein
LPFLQAHALIGVVTSLHPGFVWVIVVHNTHVFSS